MPQENVENVELLYRAYGAFNRRDLDAFLALMDPEVELTTRIMELEGRSLLPRSRRRPGMVANPARHLP